MPITRYVNTASSGGDGSTNGESGGTAAYASLSAWEAAEQSANGDLSVTGTHTVYCSTGSGTAADSISTPTVVAGWTNVSATNYIVVRGNPNTDDEASHVWDDTKYRLQGAANPDALDFDHQYCQVHNLQIWNSGAGAGEWNGIDVDLDGVVDGCFVRIEATYSSTSAWLFGISAGNNSIIRNNIVAAKALSGSTNVGKALHLFVDNVGSGTVIYNNTVTSTNITATADNSCGLWTYSHTAKNNLIYFTGTSFQSPATSYNCLNPTGGTTDYNCTSDSSATGSNSRTGQTPKFVNRQYLNFQLAVNDTAAKGYGDDLSSTGFSDDIRGVTRTTPWDIGASMPTTWNLVTSGNSVSDGTVYASTTGTGTNNLGTEWGFEVVFGDTYTAPVQIEVYPKIKTSTPLAPTNMPWAYAIEGSTGAIRRSQLFIPADIGEYSIGVRNSTGATVTVAIWRRFPTNPAD